MYTQMKICLRYTVINPLRHNLAAIDHMNLSSTGRELGDLWDKPGSPAKIERAIFTSIDITIHGERHQRITLV